MVDLWCFEWTCNFFKRTSAVIIFKHSATNYKMKLEIKKKTTKTKDNQKKTTLIQKLTE